MKLIRLSEINDNCLSVSAEQAIEDFQSYISKNPQFDKVFLIAIDTHKNEFKYIWFKGQMLTSEAITALNMVLHDQVKILEE